MRPFSRGEIDGHFQYSDRKRITKNLIQRGAHPPLGWGKFAGLTEEKYREASLAKKNIPVTPCNGIALKYFKK